MCITFFSLLHLFIYFTKHGSKSFEEVTSSVSSCEIYFVYQCCFNKYTLKSRQSGLVQLCPLSFQKSPFLKVLMCFILCQLTKKNLKGYRMAMHGNDQSQSHNVLQTSQTHMPLSYWKCWSTDSSKQTCDASMLTGGVIMLCPMVLSVCVSVGWVGRCQPSLSIIPLYCSNYLLC